MILQELGISPSELVAVGDSENDIEMLTWAGMGVAVGNASEKLKKAAQLVVSDHDHSGVAEAIEILFQE